MAVNTEQVWLVGDRDGDNLRIEWESPDPTKVTIKIDPENGAAYLIMDEDELAELIDTLSEILDTKVREQK